MTTRSFSFAAMGLIGLALFLAGSVDVTNAQQPASGAIPIDNDDLGGIVASAKGPEAGVWVIAETTDLPTRLIKSVVTDDRGRYLLPDLPKADYRVWVRGYGLVDSPKVQTAPGRLLNLTAVVASRARAAAEYYPAGYWFSLMQVPAKNEFPGNGAGGSGVAPTMRSQAEWLRSLKSGGCWACHQLGNKATRELPKALGTFPSSLAAWGHGIQVGQAGRQMNGALNRFGRQRVLALFADWTDRIAKGEVPEAPPRPQGLERNVVITQWDWADAKAYLHDEVSTDRRNPTVNANGPIYGALELSADYLPVVDPVRHTASVVELTLRDPSTPATSSRDAAAVALLGPRADLDEPEQRAQSDVRRERAHLDHVGCTAARESRFLQRGIEPSLGATVSSGLDRSRRHLAMYDPRTKQITHISTCFSTHHLMFAEDANNTLWTSGGGQVVGWLNRKMFEETGDEERSQGWTALVMDTNGNGRRDAYVEPNQRVDPSKDTRYNGAFYAVAPVPDGSVWGTQLGFPGAVIRLDPGSNPPETALAEVYELPLKASGNPVEGFSPRGGDVDRNGVFWSALASGHLASFDRRKCKGPLDGPTATGQHCPEGWTFYPEPLPQLKGVTDRGSAEASYYTWVDQFDTAGLGANVPINTGNGSEGLLALKDGKWVVLRVPYPLGFYTKWMDGRIDDPKAGWKGRGLWATYSTRAPFHMETGKGTTSKVVHFQIRPDPLAK